MACIKTQVTKFLLHCLEYLRLNFTQKRKDRNKHNIVTCYSNFCHLKPFQEDKN